MKTLLAFLALAAPLAAAAHDSASGRPADPSKAARVIEIEMNDTMRYAPAEITVKRGETVRFAVRNAGKLPHEMVLGTMKELTEHARHMKEHPGMVHSDPNMVRLAPGARGEIGWQFTRAGEFHYGCLEPGHFEAGMVGRVTVR